MGTSTGENLNFLLIKIWDPTKPPYLFIKDLKVTFIYLKNKTTNYLEKEVIGRYQIPPIRLPHKLTIDTPYLHQFFLGMLIFVIDTI
jgi:hypothetical protein